MNRIQGAKILFLTIHLNRAKLCVFVPLWLTIFHHEGTKTQRGTEVLSDEIEHIGAFLRFATATEGYLIFSPEN